MRWRCFDTLASHVAQHDGLFRHPEPCRGISILVKPDMCLRTRYALRARYVADATLKKLVGHSLFQGTLRDYSAFFRGCVGARGRAGRVALCVRALCPRAADGKNFF